MGLSLQTFPSNPMRSWPTMVDVAQVAEALDVRRRGMTLGSLDMPSRFMRVLALATLAIAMGALCGCGADSDDLSGLAADTAAAKIDDGEVFSLAGSLRTNEPNCTKNPVQPSGESISYLCRVHLLVGVNAMNATVEVVCNPEKRLCAVYER